MSIKKWRNSRHFSPEPFETVVVLHAALPRGAQLAYRDGKTPRSKCSGRCHGFSLF